MESGNSSRVAARRMLFSRPSNVFKCQGMLNTYSTRRRCRQWGRARKRRGLDGLGIVKPSVAAEHLVCRFTGQRHGRFGPDGLEQPVQRGEHIAGKTERKVACPDDGAVQI